MKTEVKNEGENSSNTQKTISDPLTGLWAQYGRLQAQREQFILQIENIIQQMRNIQIQIDKFEDKSK